MSERVPTDAELELLRLLWERGPSTVRDLHTALVRRRGVEVAYTTVLKQLQVMHEKGLVARDASDRSHVYVPTSGEEAVTGRLVTDLLDKAFGGLTSRLVQRALSERPADPEELARIRAMLDELDRGGDR